MATLQSVETEGWWCGVDSVPSAPALTGTNISTNENLLEWTPSSNTTYYKLFRSVDGGAWAAIGGDSNNRFYSAASYSDNSVTAGHSYRYKVVAYNDIGASSDSNIVTLEIETPNDVIDRDILPFRTNPYAGICAPIKLFKMAGGKGLDYRKLYHNFMMIEAQLRELTNKNFRSFAAIATSKIASIVTQDMVTLFPAFDSGTTYPPTRNLIPRLDQIGGLNLSAAHDMKYVNTAGTEGIKASSAIGAFIFEAGGAPVAYLSTDGWTTVAPASSAPSRGFAIVFDETRSLWLFYKDNDIIGVVDGNGQTSNFLLAVPATTYECEEAYVGLGESSGKIEFFCKTTADAAVKACGYIDATGTHDGGA